MQINGKNLVQVGTVVTFAGAAIGASLASMTAATTVSMVAFAILAGLAFALCLASITAAFDPDSTDVKNYFKQVGQHLGIAIAAVATIVARVFLQVMLVHCIESCLRGRRA